MKLSRRATRRQFVGRGLAGGALFGAAALAGCSSTTSNNKGSSGGTGGAVPSSPAAAGTAARAVGTSAAAASTLAPRRGGTLGIGFHVNPATLDAAASSLTDVISGVLGGVVEPLFRLSVVPGEDLVPVLATDATPNQDLTQWTFKLRRGVKFHDGTDWNAQALKFNVDRSRDPSNSLYDKVFSANTGQSYNNVSEVQVVDDFTVKYVLKTADNDLPGTLYSPVPSVKFYSPKALMELGSAGIAQKPVGTGPFHFVEWLKDDRLRFQRFDGYWGGAPYLDEIVWRVMTDNQGRLAATLSGDVDFNTQIFPTDVSAVQGKKQLQIYQDSATNTNMLIPNTRTLFKDARVRTALSLAINRKAMVEGPLGGYATVAKGPMTPIHPYFDSSLPDLTYDPQQAKALLQAAGVPNLKFTVLCASEGNLGVDYPAIEQLLLRDWSAVGVTASLNAVAYAQLLTTAAQGTTEALPMILTGWSINRPGNMATQFNSLNFAPNGKNRGYWTNAQFDDLVLKAASAQPEQAKSLERQAQQVFLSDMGQIPLFYPEPLIAVNKRVNGLPPQIKRWYEIQWEKTWLSS
jgi:peptide/nickel transport system substrate-binding protein